MTVYSKILESALIPAYYRLRGRRYSEYRDFLELSQWWTRDRILDFQWRQARHLLRHAFGSVPFYQQKYAAAGAEYGDIKTIEDFAKLPPLTRAEVNEHRRELCSTKAVGRLIPHATGGSSGVPTRFFITQDSYDWRCAASARAYSWAGYRLGDRVLYLWGAPVGKSSASKRLKLHAYRFLRRELVRSTFQQSEELWDQTFKIAQRFRPTFVVGYVSSLEQFAKYLTDKGTRVAGIQAVLAAAEPVYDSTRVLVSRAFDAPLFNTYGSREFMSISAECELHKGLHIHAENLLVQTELTNLEGSSELLITDLHNYGMPFIRYRIGDLGTFSDSGCLCGRGLPLLRTIDGRVLQVLRTVEGKIVPGEFFPHLMKDIPEVQEFRAEQKTPEEIILSLVLAHPLSGESQALIQREISKVFLKRTKVKIQPVPHIPRLPSGKRQPVIGIPQAQ